MNNRWWWASDGDSAVLIEAANARAAALAFVAKGHWAETCQAVRVAVWDQRLGRRPDPSDCEEFELTPDAL